MKNIKKYSGIIAIIVLVCIYIFANNSNYQQNTPYNENGLEKDSNVYAESVLKVHYIDQTCPIMIQRLNNIFQRNPLISMEI